MIIVLRVIILADRKIDTSFSGYSNIELSHVIGGKKIDFVKDEYINCTNNESIGLFPVCIYGVIIVCSTKK